MKPNLIFSFFVAVLFSLMVFAEESGPCPETPPQSPPPAPAEPSDSHVTTPPAETGGNTKDQLGTVFNPDQQGGGGKDGVGTLNMDGKGGGGDKKIPFGPTQFLKAMRAYLDYTRKEIENKEIELQHNRLVPKWEKQSGLKDAKKDLDQALDKYGKAAKQELNAGKEVYHLQQLVNFAGPKSEDGKSIQNLLDKAKLDPGYQQAVGHREVAEQELYDAKQDLDDAMNRFNAMDASYRDSHSSGIPTPSR